MDYLINAKNPLLHFNKRITQIYLSAKYVYCVHPAKTTAKVSEKSRNKRHSHHFQWCPLSCLCLYCYRFNLYKNRGSRKGL